MIELKASSKAASSADMVDAQRFEEMKTLNEKQSKGMEKITKKLKELKHKNKKKIDELEN